MSDVWDDVVDAIADRVAEETGRDTRFMVVSASPLMLDQIDGDETLEDGDDDVVLSDAFRQYVANYGVQAGDVVAATEAGGIWTVRDVESDREMEDLRNPEPEPAPVPPPRYWECPNPWWTGGADVAVPNGDQWTLPRPTSGADPGIYVPADVDEDRVLEVTLRVLARADSGNWTTIMATAQTFIGGAVSGNFSARQKSNAAADPAGQDWRTIALNDTIVVPAGTTFSVFPFVRCPTQFGGAYSRAVGESAFNVKRVD